MRQGDKGKVMRYSNAGVELQKIKRNDREQEMYKNPKNITENINGDVCISQKISTEISVYHRKYLCITDNSNEISVYHRKYQQRYLCITENINRDVCVSDKRAVVVVNKSGEYRFSFTGPGSRLYPLGICTDVLGHILVFDSESDIVLLPNQDSQYLLQLIFRKHGISYPRGGCMDGENNLYVGQRCTNEIKAFKYLQ
jgi:hypothetical protein